MSKASRLVLIFLIFTLLGGVVVADQTQDNTSNPDANILSSRVAHDRFRAPAPDPVYSPAEPGPTLLRTAATLAAPDTLVSEPTGTIKEYWTYGGGFLYWRTKCYADLTPVIPELRRRAENGTIVDTIEQGVEGECGIFGDIVVADDSGVFYVNRTDNHLDARPTADPGSVTTIANLSDTPAALTTDDVYVYYNQSGGIYRANKDSFGGLRISDATGVTGLAVDDTYIYWLDSTGLWRASKTCSSSPCWGNKTLMASSTGAEHLTWGEGELIWVRSDSLNWYIVRSLSGGGSSSYYSSPKTTTSVIGQPIVHDGNLFWIEMLATTNEIILRRKALPSGSVQTIADNLTPLLHIFDPKLYAGSLGAIFAGKYDIFRVSYDAAAITKDLALDAWEVTQGIQSLDNDVSLVAEKTTYVRVYGTLNAGDNANSIQVELRGSRGGVQLPGSPLQALNGPQSLALGGGYNRGSSSSGWMFQLPVSWTQAGDLHLEAVVDPRGLYTDNVPGNNTLSGDFTFTTKPPGCVVFIPVRSHAGTESTDNPNFWHMFDLYKRLWPAAEVHAYSQSEPVEELEVCVEWILWGTVPIPYPCFGPYEFAPDDEDDSSWVLASLWTRWAVSDDPDSCDDAGATTHYVGMVHPNTNTGTTLGVGYLDYEWEAWVKFPPYNQRPPYEDSWKWPTAGVTLAHELSHNYDRRHVDCGDPGGIDSSFPYSPTGWLDDGDLAATSTHYGFDVNSQAPINPRHAADYMSYCSPSWTSDYTWEAMFSRVGTSGRLANRPASPSTSETTASAQTEVRNSSFVVLASGVITPSSNQGLLNYSWVYPTASLSRGILKKWESLAVPRVVQASPSLAPQYHLRLLDANGATLDDRTITPIDISDDSSASKYSFLLTFPAPANSVAQINLMADNSVVHSIMPGLNTPNVQIIKPAGGETFDEGMTLVWQASDPDFTDRLLYNVQYSPDQGQTWHALAADLPGVLGSDTMTLTLRSLTGVPGSTTGALVRVAASDGYHTGLSTSVSFQVSNQPPQPYIVSPAPSQPVDAGKVAMLRGGASDVEDGSLSGDALSWKLNGGTVGTGSDLALAGLAPGTYDLALSAQDTSASTASANTTFTVSPLDIRRRATEPVLDGFCDDAEYQYGPVVQLKPYSDGSHAMAHMIRSYTDLWVCFGGLNLGTGGPTAFAGVRVDADYSRDSLAQTDDYGFFVKEDGTPFTKSGDGSGGFNLDGPGGLAARVSANNNVWTAELRIDASVIGGWDHVIGFDLGHYWVRYQGDDYHWPYESAWNKPNTWATTAIGKMPRITSLTPDEATAGDGDVFLLVSGSDFESGAVVKWNGQARTTTYFGSSLLSTIISAADISTAGTAEVTVENPGLGDAPSNALPFLIKNPAPSITSLSPTSVTEEGTGFTLVVNGTDFVDGAILLWDGEALTTTFVNSTQLTAAISAADITTARTIGVSVINPAPTDSASNTQSFVINPKPESPFEYLFVPLTIK